MMIISTTGGGGTRELRVRVDGDHVVVDQQVRGDTEQFAHRLGLTRENALLLASALLLNLQKIPPGGSVSATRT